MTHSTASTPRVRRRWLPFVLATLLLAALTGVVVSPKGARAAAPMDNRSTAPNHPSEMPGTGWLLTDPLQGASRAYWAGAYRTIAGAKSYCIDDFYDYPNPSYRYQAPEVSGWAARPGSNSGAAGHTAQRIIWIVNSYGQSASPVLTAAVSMSINLLTGSTPFTASYRNYFRSQLLAIDPQIVRAIDTMLYKSDRLAGPYSTLVKFGPRPVVGGVGQFTVSVHSATGVPIPGAKFRLTSLRNGTLAAGAPGQTGPTGTAHLLYTPTSAGTVTATAQGLQLPSTTMRLGFSPTHNTTNFSTGSQRVALASRYRLANLAPATGWITVLGAAVKTIVAGGSVPRPVGTPVRDLIAVAGVAPSQTYAIRVSLRDSSGLSCGHTQFAAVSDAHGRIATRSPAFATCGGGRDTFSEQVLNRAGWVLAVSAPGQPAETFPVTPSASTQVLAGVTARHPGDQVSDQVRAHGLLAGDLYAVTATLTDETGAVCGTSSSRVAADANGDIDVRMPAAAACGKVRDTFTERVTDHHGKLVVSTPAGQPTETFPLKPLPVVTHPSPTPSPHQPTPTPHQPTPSPRAPKPILTKPAPVVSVATKPVVAVRAAPRPVLASTGASPAPLLVIGGLMLSIGGALLTIGRRRA